MTFGTFQEFLLKEKRTGREENLFTYSFYRKILNKNCATILAPAREKCVGLSVEIHDRTETAGSVSTFCSLPSLY